MAKAAARPAILPSPPAGKACPAENPLGKAFVNRYWPAAFAA
jgi:hypothetical protein